MAPPASSDFTPSPKQVVFLFMAATVVAVVVFLCGVLVGRGVPLGDAMTGRGLVGPVGALLPADERPAVVSTPSREPSAAARAGDDLTYYRRLDGDPAVDLDARFREAAPPPVPDAPEASDLPPPAATPAALPAQPDPRPSSTPPSGAPASDDGFTVQVTALRERAAAERVAAGLSAKGYPAYVAEPLDDAPVVVFRVRVGRYADRADAERVLQRLEQEEALKPWITR